MDTDFNVGNARAIATKIVGQLNLDDIGESMIAIAMVIEAIIVNVVPRDNWLDSIDGFFRILKERLEEKMQEQNEFEEFLANLLKNDTPTT